MILDSLAVYQIIRKLTTPFVQMPAYRIGFIDDMGNFKKPYNDLTSNEKQLVTLLDVFVINVKRLLGKLPGGKTRLASFAAALYLLKVTPKVNESNYNDYLFTLEEDFEIAYASVELMQEDVPANATGAAVAGMDPTTLGVPVKAQKKYIRQNNRSVNFLLGMTRRKPPVKIGEDTTLEYHTELNPKIWDEHLNLRPEVHGKLLQIAEAWRLFAKIPLNKVMDIILTGGNANYNYTPLSDLDVHLVIDRNNFSVDREMVDEYLQDKKMLWSLTHSDIKIYGFPVELYAQDINEMPHSGQGVYSVLKNEWIQLPENYHLDFSNDTMLQDKVDFYKTMIDKLITDRADKATFDKLKDKIKNMRGAAIAKGGEFSFENLVFKDLRNQGYLDKMSEYERSMMDGALSLK
jgi:hypothetical protein